MNKIVLERATREDIPSIVRLKGKLTGEMRRFTYGFETKREEKFSSTSEIKKLITSKKSCIILAKMNGEIIGCGLAKIERAPALFRYKNRGYIGMLYVEKRYRKRGIAQLLQKARFDWLKSKGIKLVICVVLTQNLPSQTLARKMGFKPYYTQFYKELI